MQSKTVKKSLSLLLSVVMLAVSVFTGVTAVAEDSVYNAKRITIHPGIDDTYLNFSWFSEEKAETATLRIKAEGTDTWITFTGISEAVKTTADGFQQGYHDTFVKNCGHTCAATCGHEACTKSQCYHGTYTDPFYNWVTVSGLEYGVNYTYQLGDGTNWSKEYITHTADSDPNEGFSYLVFGDSQTADQYYGDYMKNALELSLKKFTDVDFIMNLGDNVHENNNRDYNAYFTSQDILSEYPVAVVMGNHEQNLNKGSIKDLPAMKFSNSPATDSRMDYWFRYGDVLFITFNSGSQKVSMFSSLEQLIKDAKAAHPDARWTVLQTHQGFYSNNGGGRDWRRNFVPIISKYDIDVVFSGHHHMYTRTDSLLYTATSCEHKATQPDWNCENCTGYVESDDTITGTVTETFVNSSGEETVYTKVTERTDPEGITYIHLDSLTAEGHDQYVTTAGATLKDVNAFSINTVEGQGAITKVTVNENELKVETYWINNNGTPRVSNSKPLSLLADDYIEETPYDSYTIKKTAPVKEVEVTFDRGYDRGITSYRMNKGETVTKPANPVMTGKSFSYWTADGETEYDFATAITEDITLTAVYEEIPPTTTAELFKEAVSRGDKEIILAGDITLTEVVTFKTSGVTVKSAEGQKYTITLDGAARLDVAQGKTVHFENLNITIASTIDQISAWQNGYITVGSGNSAATLYIDNCVIDCQTTDAGTSSNAFVRAHGNAKSKIYINGSTIKASITGNNGALLGGADATFYVTDSTLKPKTTSAWLCTSTTMIIKGTTTYSGFKGNGYKLYDFRNATVKIARNKDNLIELSKIGSGTAVTNSSYKIYYAFEDTAFSDGTAIEYTEPIADVDYETTVYATIKYTGQSYYGTVSEKVCGEYIEGVAVGNANAFEVALENGESLITLTSDITLTDLGTLSFGANTVVQSKPGEKYSIYLDGNTRLNVAASKTVRLNSVKLYIADTATPITDKDTDAYYNGYVTVRTGAKLYVNDCHVESLLTDMGCSTASIIKIYRYEGTTGYVELNNSTVISPAGQDKGIALSAVVFGTNTKPTFRIVDSTIQGQWVFYQGFYILEGTTTLKGDAYRYNAQIMDYRSASVVAERDNLGKVVLSVDGAVKYKPKNNSTTSNLTDYKLFYSIGDDTSGKTNEYTGAIDGVDGETPIYVTIQINKTYAFYSTPTEFTLAEVETVYGDVNGDRVVDATDLSLVRQHIVGKVTLENADLNADGEVDVRDLVLVRDNLTAI